MLDGVVYYKDKDLKKRWLSVAYEERRETKLNSAWWLRALSYL